MSGSLIRSNATWNSSWHWLLNPKALLLDEPTAGLTNNESSELAQMLSSPLNKDLAVLFVAHDLELVFELTERIMMLYYGMIIAEGTRKEIQINQTVREIYLGGTTSA